MPPGRRNLNAVPAQPLREQPPDLRDAVRDALEQMPWLDTPDGALKALALRLAAEIEGAVERAAEYAALRRELVDDEGALRRLKALEAQCDATKAVGWLGPQLQGVLRDLGGTPAARKAFQPDKPVGGRLGQLRASAPGAKPAG